MTYAQSLQKQYNQHIGQSAQEAELQEIVSGWQAPFAYARGYSTITRNRPTQTQVLFVECLPMYGAKRTTLAIETEVFNVQILFNMDRIYSVEIQIEDHYTPVEAFLCDQSQLQAFYSAADQALSND